MKNFYELFLNELRLMYNAEKQIAAAMPTLVKAASTKKLKDALKQHYLETKNQIKRIQEIGKDLGISLNGGESETMKALLKSAKKAASSNYDKHSKDAALINAIQRIEHFEMASYGVLSSFAKHFELRSAARFFSLSAKEEGNADKRLTAIAEGTWFSSGINVEAHRRCA